MLQVVASLVVVATVCGVVLTLAACRAGGGAAICYVSKVGNAVGRVAGASDEQQAHIADSLARSNRKLIDIEARAWRSCTNPSTKTFTPHPISCPNATAFPWCDPRLGSAAERASRLTAELSFDELKAQTYDNIFGGIAGIERLGVNGYNFVTENNHGILLYEVCPIPTVFPQTISSAAAFNASLWTAMGRASAIEARYNFALGKMSAVFLQSNFNIFLDPRWGRGQEVPGEDPYLNTAYAKAWVRGVQAPEGPGGLPLAGSSCKHFVAYSFEGAGGWPYPADDMNRHNFNALISARDLADTHFPMFKGCAEAGAMGMMTSYNAVNGVPSAANAHFTKDLARKTWGFNGTVVTDCGAGEDIWVRHHYRPNATEAARAALLGGTNVECGSTISEGATPEMTEMLREAVSKAFESRFRLGEFDPPRTAATGRAADDVEPYDESAHARLAYEAAVQGAVLLKNAGDVLPLPAGARLAVLGPLKDATWQALGNYAGHPQGSNWTDAPNVVSPLEGLRRSAAGSIVTPPGGPGVCSLTDEVAPGTHRFFERIDDVDAVVVVAGLYCEDDKVMDVDQRPEESGKCQGGCLESEGCDRPGLALPAGQEKLIRRAVSWGTPVILVLLTGGPVDLSELKELEGLKAILWMGFPGQAAGTALADLLFGLESPSGRLPQTFYSDAYAQTVSMKRMDVRPDLSTGHPGRSYRFVDDHWVVYPFGYGLSYHQWTYHWFPPPTSSPSLPFCGGDGYPPCPQVSWTPCTLELAASAAAPAAAGGNRVKAEPSASVLLFLVPPPSEGSPRKQLQQFVRVRGAGNQKVTFHLGQTDFELADQDGQFRLAMGVWLAEVGAPPVLRREIVISVTGCSVADVV